MANVGFGKCWGGERRTIGTIAFLTGKKVTVKKATGAFLSRGERIIRYSNIIRIVEAEY